MAQDAAYSPRLSAAPRIAVQDRGLGRLRLAAMIAAAALVIEIGLIPFVSPRFAVRQIVLRGDPRVTELVAAQVRVPPNTNLLRARTQRLREQVEDVPAVQEAQVARALPDRLVITVQRREAVAVIRQGDQAVLVDPEGAVFSVRDEWGWGLPELVARHLAPDQVRGKAGQEELAELLGVLRALGPDPRLRVTRLELAGRGDTRAVLDSGAEVRLGSAEQLEVKLKLLGAVLDRLGGDEAAYIDLSDPRAAHWRPKSSGAGRAAGGKAEEE